MTNRNMVRGPGPKPNPDSGEPRPAPESAKAARTTREPLDSPQPKPMAGAPRTKGLKKP
jgi:hypothetical protein